MNPVSCLARHSIRWSAFGLALGLTLLAGCADKGRPGGRGGGGSAPVVAGKTQRKIVPLTLDAIGAVEPIRMAAVRSQVTGVLLKIDFREGQDVQQGDLLFEIDPRPFQNAVRSAEADLQKNRVQWENAQDQLTRYQNLSSESMISKDQYQAIQTAERTLRAAVRVSEAALESAKLQLEYCSICAPISGRTGSLGAHEGDLVRASDTTVSLVAIHQLSPIYVTFAVPQQYLGTLNRHRAAGRIAATATPPGLSNTAEAGELVFLDNAIDPATGTLKLKAAFPNDDRRLWPGQFVNVRVNLAAPEVLVVPAGAVQNDQNGQHVFAIKDDQTAEFRPVTVERTVDGESVIAQGLREGETVIVDGQLRVVPGGKVEIKSAASAPAAPESRPAAPGQGQGKGKGKSKTP
jgi:membrane fusion protein, multidrug efflux system